jgi:hypothetical protein
VTCAQALQACEILAESGACAIRQVLAARGHPLASCDYHAVYRPGLVRAREELAATGRPGGAGRHLAKHAFALAVRRQVADAACRELRRALGELGRDERYAAVIARDAAASRRTPQPLPVVQPIPVHGPRLTGEESEQELAEAALHMRGIKVTGEESEQELAEAALHMSTAA